MPPASLRTEVVRGADAPGRQIPFHIVLQNTSDIITVFDRAGRILYQSPAITKVLGRDPSLRIGANIFDSRIVHPADRAGKRRFLKQLVAAGPNTEMKSEFRMQHADGSYRYIEATGINLLQDPVLQAIVLTSRDITVHRTAEAALRAQHELELRTATLLQEQEQLIAINKAKDEFVSLASHQLRTPATGVKQYIGMLLEGYAGQPSPEQRHMLSRAYDCNERQLRIIDALLSVARLDAGHVQLSLQLCDLVQLLNQVVDDLRPVIGEQGHSIVLDYSVAPIFGTADSGLLRMAVENLLDNASKYSPRGLPIDVRLIDKPETVEITIRDRGVGIPKKQQGELFQKFRRLDNPLSVAAGGSGLGLYWAKKIVDLHAGAISVRSRPRLGSVFTISLPKHSGR